VKERSGAIDGRKKGEKNHLLPTPFSPEAHRKKEGEAPPPERKGHVPPPEAV